ncbi:MAG: exodeoxyribonuclease V subunit alpha, partial [Myxococcales bacterium]
PGLILVGDRHQLASVEAGAVLADVVDGFAGRSDSPVAELITTHRTKSAGEINDLDALASALRENLPDDAVALLTGGSAQVRLVDHEDEAGMATALHQIEESALAIRTAATAGDSEAATRLLDVHRLLCAHREGPFGVGGWNRRVERMLSDRTGDTHYQEWYVGRPVLITANDRGLKLSNGDLGVTVATPEGRLRVAVRLGQQVVPFVPTRLPGAETVHAMTVHKSQGSEAEHVTVILPPVDSPLLTRELFYTAVTRARRTVTIIGSEAELRAAIGREVRRASGLADRLKARLSDRSR